MTRHLDASYLKDYQLCPEYTRLRHHLGKRLPTTSPSGLDAGVAIHAGLAAWHRSYNTTTALAAVEASWSPWSVREKLEGTAYPVSVESLQSVMRKYILQYEVKDRDWEVLDVERYLEAEIAPGVPWCGILDLRVRNHLGVIAVDHKSTSGYFSAAWWNMHLNSIQHVGYGALCRVLGLEWDGFMINGIKLPSKKSDTVKFGRSHVVRVPDWRITDVARTIEAELKTIPTDTSVEWPRREQGCFRFFRSCQFLDVCTAHPEIRSLKLDENYIEDHWDPSEKGSK